MHFNRMRTARLLTVSCTIRRGPPLDADPPRMQTPLDADSPGHVTSDACWEANPPPVDRRNDTRL